MITSYLRSSSYNAFDFCQHKTFLNYVLGLEENANKKAELGNCLHKVAECLALGKKLHQETGQVGGFNIGDEYIGEFIPDNIYDNKIISKLSKLAYTYYSSISPNDWTDKDLITIIEWATKVIAYLDGAFDPRNKKIIDVEKYFDFEIQEEWAKYEYNLGDRVISGNLSMKGTIDLITQVDDDHYEVLDYKSGRRLDWATGKEKTYESLKKDSQLLLYLYACRQIYPDVPFFTFTIYYVNDGGPFTLCFDDKDVTKAENLIRTRFEQMKNTQYPKLLNETPEKRAKDFKCKSLCHFYKNNYPGTDMSICEFFQKKVKESSADLVTLEYGNLDKLGVYGDGGGRKLDSTTN